MHGQRYESSDLDRDAFGMSRVERVGLAQGDLATMEREEALAKVQPDLEWSVYYRHGDMATAHGQIRQAQDFYDKARQVGQRVQIKSAEGGLSPSAPGH